MRIAHFVASFSALSETFIYDFVTEMRRQGTDSPVLTLARLNEKDRPYPDVRLLPRTPARLAIRALVKAQSLLSPAWAARFDALGVKEPLRSLRPDAAWAHFGGAGPHVIAACRSLDCPLIVTFQGGDIYAANSRWKRRYRTLFTAADRIVAASQDIAAALLAAGAPAEKLSVLYNGIRVEDFPYSDPSLRFDGRRVNLLQVGRLVAKKDPLQTLEAFALLLRQLPSGFDPSLTIAGDGPLRPALHRRIKTLGLQERVLALGGVPRSRVRELLGQAHVYVQSGKTALDGDREGLGVSFTEAAACGLPIVSNRHGGIPEIVLDGVTGILAPEGNAAALAMALAQLIRTPHLWSNFGRAGRAHVEARFKLEVQVARAIALAGEACQGRRA